jgi:hypothetical protein
MMASYNWRNADRYCDYVAARPVYPSGWFTVRASISVSSL